MTESEQPLAEKMKAEQSCGTCRFARESRRGLECHRWPPQVIIPAASTTAWSTWPKVGSVDWCGEFERR